MLKNKSRQAMQFLILDSGSHLEEALQSYGTAVSFCNTDEAKGWCKKNTPDMIFVHHTDGGIDGAQALHELRSFKPHLMDVPTLLVGCTTDCTATCVLEDSSQLSLVLQALMPLSSMQKKLKQAQRYEVIAENIPEGLVDWDFESNEAFYSSTWKKIVGLEGKELPSDITTWFSLIHPEDLPQVDAELHKSMNSPDGLCESDFRLFHEKGEYIWIHMRGKTLKDATGKSIRFVCSHTDITLEKSSQEKILHEAFHEPLTGLPNRMLVLDRINQALSQKDSFALLLIDVDRMKKVNESLGHSVGDQFIKIIARRLERCCRLGDTVGRFGGDEYILVINELDNYAEATAFVDRMYKEVTAPFKLEGQEFFPSISVGIAFSRFGYVHGEDIIRDAELALYKAKAKGRSRFEFFDEGMLSEAKSSYRLEISLRRALDKREITFNYQPIISIDTGKVVGFEALMRWNHPDHGSISPTDFIPMAEEMSLIVPLGRLALVTACSQLMEWHRLFPDRPKYFMNINVSPKQLFTDDFVDDIRRILSDSHVEPSFIKLELTETAVMDRPTEAEMILTKLKSLGVKLAIDDFGTGFSSLSYLSHFPFDTLKIDRSFISQIDTQSRNEETAKLITLLGGSLGMDIVAEGVETVEELEILKKIRCHYAQGYYFSQPVSAEEILLMLREDKTWKLAS